MSGSTLLRTELILRKPRLPSPSGAFGVALGALAALSLSVSCGARTGIELETNVDAGTKVPPRCGESAPLCTIASQACEPPTTVLAACEEASGSWSCPSGTRPYSRAPATAEPCLPFRHAQGLERIHAWGVAGLARIPIEDGRCLWVASQVTLTGGRSASNVALEPDPSAPFGSCPDESRIPPTAIVSLEGGDNSSIVVAINGAYRLQGITRVLYRLFRVDPGSAFGISELGSGLAHYDPQKRQIIVPDPAKPLPWGLDLDLGDATLVVPGAPFGFAWGCTDRMFFNAGCFLARLDATDSVELFTSGGWLKTTDPSRATTVFSSGTWVSSVVRVSSGLRHVYIDAFGHSLLAHRATNETGPWSDSAPLGACHLPAADPNAFCAGPIVQQQLSDPTRPGELAISYQIGTMGPSTGSADEYWPRLEWLQSP